MWDIGIILLYRDHKQSGIQGLSFCKGIINRVGYRDHTIVEGSLTEWDTESYYCRGIINIVGYRDHIIVEGLLTELDSGIILL